MRLFTTRSDRYTAKEKDFFNPHLVHGETIIKLAEITHAMRNFFFSKVLTTEMHYNGSKPCQGHIKRQHSVEKTKGWKIVVKSKTEVFQLIVYCTEFSTKVRARKDNLDGTKTCLYTFNTS